MTSYFNRGDKIQTELVLKILDYLTDENVNNQQLTGELTKFVINHNLNHKIFIKYLEYIFTRTRHVRNS